MVKFYAAIQAFTRNDEFCHSIFFHCNNAIKLVTRNKTLTRFTNNRI